MPSIFRTPADRTAYLRAYDEMLRRWPRPALRSFDTKLGWLALQLAVNRPAAVGPIVVVCPASGPYPFHWYSRLFLQLAEKLPFRPSAQSVLAAQVHRGYELEETFVALMDAVSAHVRTHVLFPAPLTDDELALIRTPTLILIGEDERLYNPAAALE